MALPRRILIAGACASLLALPHPAYAQSGNGWSALSQSEWVDSTGSEIRELTDLANQKKAVLAAAKRGDARAQVLQAMAVYRGNWGDEPNPTEALALLRKFSDLSDLRGAAILAEVLLQHAANDANRREAVRLFEELDRRDVYSAAASLGALYSSGQIVGKDDARATAYFKRSAEGGNAYGQQQYAYALYNGTGTERDRAAAEAMARKAADAGMGDAARLLAISAEKGATGTVDEKAATYWYGRAHELGLVAGSIQYALRLAEGKGVEKDAGRARDIALAAAKGGDASAMELAGFLADKGIGAPANPDEAFGWYLKAAEAGDGTAMRQVWKRYGAGHGVTKDLEAAQGWALKAAEAGDVESMHAYGNSLWRGTVGPRDPDGALPWIQKAADKGYEPSLKILADMAAVGVAGERGSPESFALQLKAAETGDPIAMRRVGFAYYNGNAGAPGKDVAKAVSFIKRAAEGGDPQAMRLLAYFYQYSNTPLERDIALAAEWYRKAAEGGDKVAMGNYAGLLESGAGVASNPAEAARWAQAGQEKGDPHSTYLLGKYYGLGFGLPKDDSKAVQYYREAADAGSVDGMYWYGVRLTNGGGIAKNEVEGARWTKMAADKGLTEAEKQYGTLLTRGMGVAKDPASATKYYSKAVDGFRTAGNDREASRVSEWLAFAARDSGQRQLALSASETAVELARQVGDQEALTQRMCLLPTFVLVSDAYLEARSKESIVDWPKGAWPVKSREVSKRYGATSLDAAKRAVSYSEDWAARCLQDAAWAMKVGNLDGQGAGAESYLAHTWMLSAAEKFLRLGDRKQARVSYLEAARMAILSSAPGQAEGDFDTSLKRFCRTLLKGGELGLYSPRQIALEKGGPMYRGCVFSNEYR